MNPFGLKDDSSNDGGDEGRNRSDLTSRNRHASAQSSTHFDDQQRPSRNARAMRSPRRRTRSATLSPGPSATPSKGQRKAHQRMHKGGSRDSEVPSMFAQSTASPSSSAAAAAAAAMQRESGGRSDDVFRFSKRYKGEGGLRRRGPASMHSSFFGHDPLSGNSDMPNSNPNAHGDAGIGREGSRSQDSSNAPPLPSLKVIARELCVVCSLYMRYAWRSMKRPCNSMRRISSYVVLRLVIGCFLLACWILFDFFSDGMRVCTPPPHALDHGDSAGGSGSTQNPLVEYYVHGRGIGHYARSVAIVDQLNEAGVDVRLFLSRASMWRAMHEDSKLITHSHERKGVTTALSVSSLTPSMSFFSMISHVAERIINDCEVSINRDRYPVLVISDGDLPGMLRAKLGGIPSVGIAHGQLFHIAQTPSWITNNAFLSQSWQKQATLNFRSSFFSEWQIATHFCFLESAVKSGTVARAPMRPEVIRMAYSRRYSQRTGRFAPVLPREDQVKHLLLDSLEPPLAAKSAQRRKIVICYFRDHNGAIATRALLQAGFDVLLFDNGYFRDMLSDPNRYGAKWIVHNHDEVREARGVPYTELEQQHRREMKEQATKEERKMKEDVHRRLVEDSGGSLGGGGMGNANAKEELGHPRLIRVMDRSMFVPLMSVADGVASSAGSQLMSECIFSEMPLLAHYLESDDEQRLNVELSRHVDSSCQKPHVFGNSFETLSTASRQTGGVRGGSRNKTSSFFDVWGADNAAHMWDEFDHFVDTVQQSKVSESFYRFYEKHEHVTDVLQPSLNNVSTDEYPETTLDAVLARGHEDTEDNLNSLPEAAEIILEIIKLVNEGRQ